VRADQRETRQLDAIVKRVIVKWVGDVVVPVHVAVHARGRATESMNELTVWSEVDLG